ncbi:ABC transporter ATP-binding protein [Mesorhizobium sp. INR15]|uniref:ABC transporter ATP-binding protein n=1 Tax=Mesorhizobium sp. INR15 TaxID=2654248 RepID=UPI0018966A3C|nr:ABC transporter ATP-binding protein [Mesorhizobium sp. INR15]QPC94529.1 ATP-binding cassette domain-containing protein [Mesorhizobium sp. INR15]
MSTALRVEGLTKRFAGVAANDHVDFDLRPGEIHCLFGENGAGKSTLSSCIFGLYRPDEGQTLVRDEPVHIGSPIDAIRLGIGMVHQHFVLVPEFTVLENIIVGTQRSGWRLNAAGARQKLRGICDGYGIEMDLDAYVWELPVGRQQWVEILKALYLDARILILDEPTAVLTPGESRILFDIIGKMCARGLSIILITHKLVEVMQSNRVTVLRKGKVVATLDTADTSPDELARLMVGRDVSFTITKPDLKPGETVVAVEKLTAHGHWGEAVLKDVSFSVAAYEILGIAGVAGNGQKELFEVLCGVRKPVAGTIRLKGENVAGLTPRCLMDRGVGHIPDDRFREGLVPEFSVAENLVLGWQRSPKYRSGPLINGKAITELSRQMIGEYQIATRDEKVAAGKLSGGNAQKIIIAREFLHASGLMLANQPTRGLDVGVIEYVQSQLLKKRAEGFAIVLASEELSDLFGLADRIAVMFKGEIMGIVDPKKTTVSEVGAMMTGRKEGATP